MTSKFTSFLKMANITHFFKKLSKVFKEICKDIFRSGSILPVLSKTFKKIMSKQLSAFSENILSKFQCEFRKGYSTQYLTLKASDCLSRDILIAKMLSYCLSLTSLRLLSDYLSDRKQPIKAENVFSTL